MKKRLISIFLIISIITSVCAVGIVTTSAATTGIAAPTGFSLSNQNGALRATWNKVSGAIRYYVYYRPAQESKWRSYVAFTNKCDIQNLVSGKLYCVQILSIGKGGYYGHYTKVKSYTYLATPRYGVNYTTDRKKFNVHWGGIQGANYYEVVVFINNKKYSAYSGPNTSFIHQLNDGRSALAPGGPYYYQIRALYKTKYNGTAYSAWSNRVPVYFAPSFNIDNISGYYYHPEKQQKYYYDAYWSDASSTAYYTVKFYKNINSIYPEKTCYCKGNSIQMRDNNYYGAISVEYRDIPKGKNTVIKAKLRKLN